MDRNDRASRRVDEQPTRKVDSMSELAASMILEDENEAEQSGPRADADALAVSRLIEVRSSPPPPPTSSPPPAWTPSSSRPEPVQSTTRWTRTQLAAFGTLIALLLVVLSVAVTLFVVR